MSSRRLRNTIKGHNAACLRNRCGATRKDAHLACRVEVPPSTSDCEPSARQYPADRLRRATSHRLRAQNPCDARPSGSSLILHRTAEVRTGRGRCREVCRIESPRETLLGNCPCGVLRGLPSGRETRVNSIQTIRFPCSSRKDRIQCPNRSAHRKEVLSRG